MRKSEIINKVSQKTGIPKVDIILVLENTFKIIKESVKNDEPVYIRKFGTFQTKLRKQKKARIVKKNIEIIVPEHHIPYFKPSKEFMNLIKF